MANNLTTPKKLSWKKVFGFSWADIAAAFIGIALFLIIVPTITYATYGNSLIDKEALMNRNDQGIVLYDRNNQPFFAFYQGKPTSLISLDLVPKVTQDALIASEDKDFFQHPGISLPAIARSLYEDIQGRSLSYGGSTITQQLVKNVLLTPTKDFIRKYQEASLAMEVERRYSKKEILEMYLNSVYFGEGAFGIQEASKTYFNKPASKLDLAESAMLVAVLPAPSRLSPLNGDLQAAKARQKIVLQKMVEQGYISQEQATQAINEQLAFSNQPSPLNRQAVHFAMLVRDQLIAKYGEEAVIHSGYRVKTTIDLNLQNYAQEVVRKQVANLAGNRVTNGAAVVMDPKTGEVLALVGSKDWFAPGYGQVDVATSPRQPGSSFKPIYYSAALEQGIITPATILQDVPTDFGGGYKPHDYDGKYRGPVTVRRALANSLNIPSVAVMKRLGVGNAIDQAQKMGITTLTSPSQYGLSLGLGAGEVTLLEMTGAYSVLADNGQKNDVATILEINDKYGDPVYTYHPNPQPVLSADAAFLISSILSDNKTRAEEFGTTLNISRTAAVKTGTTENFKDAWTLGYTPSVVVGAWVGNNNGAPMDNIAGSLGAAPIWKQLMERTLTGTPVETFALPDNGVKAYNCSSNKIIQSKDPNDPNKTTTKVENSAYQEYFIVGTAPSYCRVQNSLTPTPTVKPSTSLTPTLSESPVPTSSPVTFTPTPTKGPPQTPSTPTPTPTQMPTPTNTPSPTPTLTPTPTPTPR